MERSVIVDKVIYTRIASVKATVDKKLLEDFVRYNPEDIKWMFEDVSGRCTKMLKVTCYTDDEE